ncbi:hypothetical protein Ancab_011409, partial [Ancistrocladus abbreviatus]
DGHAFALSVIEEGTTIAGNLDQSFGLSSSNQVSPVNLQSASCPCEGPLEARRCCNSGVPDELLKRSAGAALGSRPVVPKEIADRNSVSGGQCSGFRHGLLHSSWRLANPLDLDPRTTELAAEYRRPTWGSRLLGNVGALSTNSVLQYGPEENFGGSKSIFFSGRNNLLSPQLVRDSGSAHVGEGDQHGEVA